MPSDSRLLHIEPMTREAVEEMLLLLLSRQKEVTRESREWEREALGSFEAALNPQPEQAQGFTREDLKRDTYIPPQPEQKHCGGSGEEACKRCRGRKRVIRPGMDPGNPNEKWGDPERFYMPCPDCQPQQEGEEDWPEVYLHCCGGGNLIVVDTEHPPPGGFRGGSLRRYLPAPTQGGEERGCLRCDESSSYRYGVSGGGFLCPPCCALVDPERFGDDADFYAVRAWRTDEEWEALGWPPPASVKEISEHPNQEEGSGEPWQATAERATNLAESAANLGIKRTLERDEARTALERLAEWCDGRAKEMAAVSADSNDACAVSGRTWKQAAKQALKALVLVAGLDSHNLASHQGGGEEKTGVELIAAERQRQVSEEGWTPGHDDQHDDGELARAAACYAMPEHERGVGSDGLPAQWPFEDEAWKPTPEERVRELTKAGALIAAEIDRLLRAHPEGQVERCKHCGGDPRRAFNRCPYCRPEAEGQVER